MHCHYFLNYKNLWNHLVVLIQNFFYINFRINEYHYLHNGMHIQIFNHNNFMIK